MFSHYSLSVHRVYSFTQNCNFWNVNQIECSQKCVFVSSSGNFLFWGALCGKSPVSKVCDTLQQAGTSPQQLLVSFIFYWNLKSSWLRCLQPSSNKTLANEGNDHKASFNGVFRIKMHILSFLSFCRDLPGCVA